MFRRATSTVSAQFSSRISSSAPSAALLFASHRRAVADYQSPHDFDPMTMKFFCDGTESELMADTRKVALAAVQQHRLATTNRSVERETTILRDRLRFMLNPPAKILAARSDKTAASSDNFLISLAQYRTTPGKFYALYEAAAMVDAPLAFALASHFSLSSCLVSAYRPHMSAITSGNVDTGACFFTGAHQEVIADDAPFQTVVHLDAATGMLKLSTREESGGGKVVLALGTSARYAVVSVQLLTGGGEMKPQLLLLELRDAAGRLRPGVSAKGFGSTGGAIDGLASCIVHLNEVMVPVDCLLTCDIDPATGHVVDRDASLDAAAESVKRMEMKMKQQQQQRKPQETNKDENSTNVGDGEEDGGAKAAPPENANPLATNAMLNVATSQRLAVAALCLGKSKRLLHDIVRFSASKKVHGPTGERTHPTMGVQTVQRRVASAVCDVMVLTCAYHRVLETFTSPGVASRLGTEDFVELAAISSELVELLARLGKLGTDLCGWQSTLAVSGFNEAIALAALWREGTNPDYVRFLYSRECMENNIGLLGNVSRLRQRILGGNSRLSQWMSNPFFSPTSNEMNRYLMLFGEKELQTRNLLQSELRVAQRKGPEDMFYVWNNEQLRTVISHSDAYTNVLCVRAMLDALQKSRDPFNTRVLNDIAWLWCLRRIEGDLDWYLRNKAMKLRQVRHLATMAENLSNLISNQAVHLVDCFGINRMEVESPLPRDWEEYWGPPKGQQK